MRPWRHLTVRGRVLLVCGAVLATASLAAGQRDMAWVGLLLVLLPLLGLLLVLSTRMRMRCERTVHPSRCVLGSDMQVETTLTRSAGLPVGILRFEEEAPRALGPRPRFAVHTLSGSWRRTVRYTLTGSARGRYTVGPMLVRACDPFGTALADHRFTSATQVMVTPRIYPLSTIGSAAGPTRSGDSTPEQIGSQGSDDVLIREYRQGDDIRRVHWRSTAHLGDLMVRREEQSMDPAVTVLLDSRGGRHAGNGPHSSFEWAVSAAASVCTHMLANGFRVRLADASGQIMSSDDVDVAAARERTLVTLTDERMGDEDDLAVGARACAARLGGDTVVAILGRLQEPDLVALDEAGRRRSQRLALVLDTDTFTALRFRCTPEQLDEHERTVQRLTARGWRVVPVRRGDDVTGAWSRLERIGVVL